MKIKGIIIKIIVLLIVFCIILSGYFLVFSNKLSDTEYQKISSFYTEMILVEPNIKNDFYIEKLLKVLDKKIVLSEFKSDALIYSLTIIGNSMDMQLDGRSFSYIYDYINRCYLSFSDFVGTEGVEKIFNVSKTFYQSSLFSEDRFEKYEEDIEGLITPLENEIVQWHREIKISIIIVVIVYFLLLFLWIWVEIKYKKRKNIES